MTPCLRAPGALLVAAREGRALPGHPLYFDHPSTWPPPLLDHALAVDLHDARLVGRAHLDHHQDARAAERAEGRPLARALRGAPG